MRSKGACAALGLTALFALVSLDAAAQAGTNVFVASQPPNDAVYVSLGYDVSPTIQQAVDKAVAAAASVYQHYDVLVDPNGGAAWLESVSIYADADISLVGISGPSGDTSQDVILQAPVDTQSAIEIKAPLDSTNPVNKIVVEGFTLTGSFAGFHGMNGAAPTLNRVYIKGNVGSGVLCEDGSYVLLINCSIVENAGDGVEVNSNSFARVVFCTIYKNSRSGVYVDSSFTGGGNAHIENSIVFQNAQSGLEWTAAISPTLNSNDVYGNGPTGTEDYINVTPDTNSLNVDPVLWKDTATDPTPWLGALEASKCIYGIYGVYDVYNSSTSPVIDMADPGVAILPYTAEDFYGDTRPTAYLDPATPLPDMGADEVVRCGFGLDLPLWYQCIINPDPVTGEARPVGKLAAGDLKVTIGLTRVGSVTPILYLVPQAGSPTDPATWITFNLTGSTGDGIYYYENAIAVDSTALGYIVDGHAIAYLTMGSYTFGLTGVELIEGQALIGRHTIIDTVPPRMVAPAAPGGLSAAPPLVNILNGGPLTATAGAASANHPALPGFPVGWLPATDPAPVWLPAAPPNNVYDGLITQDIFVGLGAQVFTNAGSISNGINGDNLNIQMTVGFEDLPPTDSSGALLTDRVVSGFWPSNTETTVGPSNGVAEWTYDVGGALFAGAAAQCVYTTSGTNLGYDPTNPGGPTDFSYDYNNSTTEGVWTFTDSLGNPGLDWNRAPAHSAVRFRAIDRAGNKTEVTKELEPLQIWWMTEAQSRIVPNQEGQTIPEARFNIQMTRIQNPVVTPAEATNGPLFTYRFYTSADITGPYTPATGWAPWTAWTPTSTIFQPGNFGGAWALLVTLSADEAGNVEQWPIELGTPDAPTFVAQNLNGENWMRFRIGAGNLDTSLSPNFWHDAFGAGQGVINAGETQFGAQNIIPSPADLNVAYVAAQFRITMQASTPSTNMAAMWFLSEAGSTTTTDSGYVPDPTAGFVVTIPTNVASYHLEDINPIAQARRARNWVFSAATFTYQDSNSDGRYESTEVVLSIDPTPASFAFTVVPQTSIEAYVRNRESMDRQPIKVQEER